MKRGKTNESSKYELKPVCERSNDRSENARKKTKERAIGSCNEFSDRESFKINNAYVNRSETNERNGGTQRVERKRVQAAGKRTRKRSATNVV